MRPADIGCPAYAPFVSATSGYVGISTSAPNAELDVVGMVSASTLRLWNSIGPAQSQMFGNRGAYNVPAMQLLLGNNTTGIAHIQALTGRASLTKGQLVFSTRDITLDERMRIDEFGNIGIGTIAPSTTLHVSGTLRISNGGEACDANRAGAIRYTSSSVFQFCMGSGWQNLADAAGGGQADRITSGTTSVIATQDRSVTISTAGTQRVVIGENGNVGIGTVAPLVTLHAHGTGYFQGELSSSDMLSLKTGPQSTREAFMRRPTTNNLTLGTANTERLRIDSVGNIGIGTSSPTATLQVSGSFIVSTSAQTTTPSLYVGTNGNVGVGTTSPQSKLHLVGVSNTSGGLTIGAAYGTDRLAIHTTGSVSSVLRMLTNGGLFVQSSGGSNIAGFQSNNFGVGIGRNFANAGTPTDGLLVEGNVGIGTTAPTRTLDVSGSANISGTVKIAGTGAEPCNASSIGTIRYNAAAQAFQMCRP